MDSILSALHNIGISNPNIMMTFIGIIIELSICSTICEQCTRQHVLDGSIWASPLVSNNDCIDCKRMSDVKYSASRIIKSFEPVMKKYNITLPDVSTM